MKIAATVWASYQLLFANFGAFFQIAIRWALLATFATVSSQLVGDVDFPEESGAYFAILAPVLLATILSAAGSICVAIVWHRFAILGEPALRFFPTERDVLGPYVVRATASMILPIGFFVMMTWIWWDDDESVFRDALTSIGVTLLLAMGVRLWLALPACAVGDRATTFRASWQATRGHGLALCAGLLACDLPLTAAGFAVDQLTSGYDDNSLEGLSALVATLVFDLARNVVWTVFISYAYLELVRPAQAQAEHFR